MGVERGEGWWKGCVEDGCVGGGAWKGARLLTSERDINLQACFNDGLTGA